MEYLLARSERNALEHTGFWHLTLHPLEPGQVDERNRIIADEKRDSRQRHGKFRDNVIKGTEPVHVVLPPHASNEEIIGQMYLEGLPKHAITVEKGQDPKKLIESLALQVERGTNLKRKR